MPIEHRGSARHRRHRLLRGVVSGGQTGVDRAALDAAEQAGMERGGWCPRGRAAEDGVIPSHYPLRETPSDDPAERTAWNILDTDATLILAPGLLAGGTALTAEIATRRGRPLLVVDPRRGDPAEVREWLRSLPGPVLLNIAGPRESEVPGIYREARLFLASVLLDE